MDALKTFFGILAALCCLCFLLYRFIWLSYSVYGILTKDKYKSEEGEEKSLDKTCLILLLLSIFFIALYTLLD